MATTESNATAPEQGAPLSSILFYDDFAPVQMPASVRSFASFREWDDLLGWWTTDMQVLD